MSAGTVGMVGLGIMGGAMSTNLLERGWTVIGADLDATRIDAFKAAGGRPAASTADVARMAPIIILSLPTPGAARAVAEEIASSGAPPRIIIETSTLALEDKEAIRDILQAGGHTPLDCPLSGTGAQAKHRDVVVYASGDSHAIASARPVFDDFARSTVDLGAFGNGTKMKFVANLLVAIHNVAAAEAMALGARAGLDAKQLVEVAGAGAGGSRMFQMRAPMMAEGVYEPATMRVSTWRKDMEVIGAFARAVGCATPLFDATDEIYTAAYDAGQGEEDTASVYRIVDRMGRAAE